MPATAMNTRATVMPCLVYRDAPAALLWLCDVVGFERHAVHPTDDGGIAHAELAFGNGMIMLGSVNDGDYGRHVRPPAELGGMQTQSPYLVVADPDDLYRRVVAAGAEIVMPLRSEDYGGRHFTFRDPEGYLWNVGSYDPWGASSI